MKVKDCMCNNVCCVNEDTKIKEVAKLMNDNHIGCIPVCDTNNRLCGIVTDRDILLRCITCDKDVNQTPVKNIMTSNVYTCTADEDMTNAETKMSEKQVRRLPVCDDKNHVVGILTMGDLAHHDTKLGKQEVCTTIENICNTAGQTKNAE